MTIGNVSMLEAVQLAIDMEEEGITFYSLARDRFDDPDVKTLFALLLEKEYSHLTVFRGILVGLGEKDGIPDQDLYLMDPDVAAYLRSYVESAVFPVKGAAEEALATVRTPRDAARIGMQAEKDSILYYHELACHSTYPEAVEAIKLVIAEERNHYRLLHRLWMQLA